jgi:hypothetical protein
MRERRIDRRTLAGRAEAPRGDKVQLTLQLDEQLTVDLTEAARLRGTSRVSLISSWLADRLAQEAALGTADKAL